MVPKGPQMVPRSRRWSPEVPDGPQRSQMVPSGEPPPWIGQKQLYVDIIPNSPHKGIGVKDCYRDVYIDFYYNYF